MSDTTSLIDVSASEAIRLWEQEKESNEEKNVMAPNQANPIPSTLVRPEYRTEAPAYLVLTREGSLAGYMRPDILKCDLAINKRNGDPAVQVFKLTKGFTIQYAPISAEEIQ